jgi:thymidylate synthase
VIAGPTFGKVWDDLLASIMMHGERVSPRNKPTLELTPVTILVQQARNNILVNDLRGLNYRFMVAEWLWIWFGMNELEPLARYNSVYRSFSDDDKTLAGAYGPRLADQWGYTIGQLKLNPDSRQAVSVIWTRNPRPSKDIPCTLTFQFLVRQGCLNLIVTMRSSDVWLGLPYDFFSFSQLLNIWAGVLSLPVGWLAMNLGSSHLYLEHWSTAHACITSDLESETLTSPVLPGVPPVELGMYLRNGNCDKTFYTAPAPWDAYHEALSAHKSVEALRFLKYGTTDPR